MACFEKASRVAVVPVPNFPTGNEGSILSQCCMSSTLALTQDNSRCQPVKREGITDPRCISTSEQKLTHVNIDRHPDQSVAARTSHVQEIEQSRFLKPIPADMSPRWRGRTAKQKPLGRGLPAVRPTLLRYAPTTQSHTSNQTALKNVSRCQQLSLHRPIRRRTLR